MSEISGEEILFLDADTDDILDILKSDRHRSHFSTFYSCNLFNVKRSGGLEIPAIQAGFRGLYYHDVLPDQILQDLPYLMSGGVQLPKQLLFEALHQKDSDLEIDSYEKKSNISLLTKREKDILSILAKGAANKEISETLCISEATVKRHLSNIYEKTGIHNRRLLVEHFYDGKVLIRCRW
ncbi:MAG: response regulator transcription factor [Spirochaetales bacterium]|nr:response regulator transcription factor [Spirochaetales bacterium]